MDKAMKARLEIAGFRETDVQELLGLTAEENEMIETRLALARLVRFCEALKWSTVVSMLLIVAAVFFAFQGGVAEQEPAKSSDTASPTTYG